MDLGNEAVLCPHVKNVSVMRYVDECLICVLRHIIIVHYLFCPVNPSKAYSEPNGHYLQIILCALIALWALFSMTKI